jgi:hypothetical protein
MPIRAIIFFITILCLLRCSSYEIVDSEFKTPNTGLPVIIEENLEKCKSDTVDYSQWYFLFNTFKISFLSDNLDTMFPKGDASYRIVSKTTWKDLLISFPLAYTLTVTRKTISVQQCEGENKVIPYCRKKGFGTSVEDVKKEITKEFQRIELKSGKYLWGEISERGGEGQKTRIKLVDQYVDLSQDSMGKLQNQTEDSKITFVEGNEPSYSILKLKSGVEIKVLQASDKKPIFFLPAQTVEFKIDDFVIDESNSPPSEEKEPEPATDKKSQKDKKKVMKKSVKEKKK